MSADAPAPVTRPRLWRLVAEFYVDDTPDPHYDPAACDRLADELNDALHDAIEGVGRIADGSVKLPHLQTDDD